MTLFELLCALREKLIEAKENNDARLLDELSATFTILEEVTSYDNKELKGLFNDMKHHIIDFSQGVPWKSSIPSIETLKKVAEDKE